LFKSSESAIVESFVDVPKMLHWKVRKLNQ